MTPGIAQAREALGINAMADTARRLGVDEELIAHFEEAAEAALVSLAASFNYIGAHIPEAVAA